MPKLKKSAMTTLSEAASLMEAHEPIFNKYIKRNIRKNLTFSSEDIARLTKVHKRVQSAAKVKIYYADIVRAAIVICEHLSTTRVLKAIDESNANA